jgi:hypothetical protein
MDYYALKGEVRQLKSESNETKTKLQFTGGRVSAEMLLKATEADVTLNGENGTEFSDGQMLFLDFGFQPTDKIEGQFTINILGNVADTEPLEINYGRRGLPQTVLTVDESDGSYGRPQISETVVNDRERVEIYDFEASYQGKNVDINAFYHTPRYHWGYEGDFFGLVPETTDLAGMDIWNSKAPEGIEFIGKKGWKGLTIVAGPEIYWGANPKIVLKYDYNIGKVDMTFIHSEDVARQGESSSATGATERQSRQTTKSAASCQPPKRLMTSMIG